MTATASPAVPAPSAERLTPRQIAGAVVVRIVVPLWLGAGAFMKLQSMNPKLLPPPVLSVVERAAGAIGQPVTDVYDPALRLIITAEIALALMMVLAPKVSRFIAVAVLTLFCAILASVLMKGSASCGCFGAGGPPPWVILIVDGALLLAALALPFPTRRYSWSASAGVATAAVVLGGAVAWTAPGIGPTAIETPHDHDTVAAPASDQPAPDGPPSGGLTDSGDSGTARTAGSGAAAAGTAPVSGPAPWPRPPATARPYYDADFKSWVGKRLDQQELPLLIQQPLPLNPNAGRLHIVFMREDCEHCHELLETYFSLPKLETPTLAVVVPDATGQPLMNPCTDCKNASLIKGGIIWMFTTPVLVTVQDGIVVGVCEATDADKPEAVRAALNAGKP
jgi:hypothetical protein